MSFGVDWASMDGNKPNAITLKQAGCSFAIARMAYGMSQDQSFFANRKQFADAKIPFGGYAFPRYPRPGQIVPGPDVQAKQWASWMGELGELEFPMAVDLEFSTDVQKETGLSPVEMVTWFTTILDTLESIYGHRSIVYTSARVVVEPLKGQNSPTWYNCPLWVKGIGGTKYLSPYLTNVRQPAVLSYKSTAQPNTPQVWKGSWHCQQYQGDALSVPSMAGTTDVNRFHYLTSGAVNETVKWIQHQLSQSPTGSWDDKLSSAFMKFQASQGLLVDNWFGPASFARLARFPVVEQPDC